MRPTMARDFVAFPSSPRENLRMLRYHFAEHEECGLDMMRGEYIEQFRRKRCAWSVVKGHRYVRAIDVDRIKCDRRFFGRGRSFCRSFIFHVRRCGWLSRGLDRVDRFSALGRRHGLSCKRNSETQRGHAPQRQTRSSHGIEGQTKPLYLAEAYGFATRGNTQSFEATAGGKN